MYLIQVFLPLRDNLDRRIPQTEFTKLRELLETRFGGLTVYSRAPAVGRWKSGHTRRVDRDDIVICEVMAPRLQRRWWQLQREKLQQAFRQKDILIRAHPITRL